MSMPSLGEAVLDLAADGAGLMKDIDATKPGVLGKLQQLGNMGGKVLGAGLMTAAAVLTTITAMVWNAGGTLDAAYDQIAINTGATGAKLEGLQKDFDAVFQSVPTDAGTAADAISLLNQRLGLSGPALQNVAKPLLEVTRITGGDLKTNAEAFTRLVGDWGIPLDEASEGLDKVYVASQQTGTPIDRLMQLMVQFGAPMRQFGFSFEEGAAMLGKWEKEGVNTELVMGSLRIASGKFADANKPLKQGLEETFDAIKNAEDGSKALSIAMDVFGARAGPDMAAAIRENRFELGDLVGTLEGADGTIMDTAAATMDWGERWTMFKNKMTVALGPAGMGLMESVNKMLTALEDTLARPDVQAALMSLVGLIGQLAQSAATNLPGVITRFFQLIEYLKNNQGIVIGVLAVLGVAFLAFGINAAIAGAMAMAPLLPIIGIIMAIIAVVALVYAAWTNNWGGIQEKVAAVWGFLQPIFAAIVEWFKTNIPAAIKIVSGFWTNTLLPAINKVWSWLSTTLFPLFKTIAAFLGAVFGLELKLLAAVWTNVLQPALMAVWDVISAKVMPIFDQIVKFMQDSVMPVLEDLGELVNDTIVAAFEWLSGAIQGVIDWLNTMIDLINGIVLPDWLGGGGGVNPEFIQTSLFSNNLIPARALAYNGLATGRESSARQPVTFYGPVTFQVENGQTLEGLLKDLRAA